MLKRVLHITTVLWLINALVCFHPAFSENQLEHTSSISKEHPENTLLDIAYNLITGEKDDAADNDEKPGARARYIGSRSVSSNIIVSVSVILSLFSVLSVVTLLPVPAWRFWESKVFLPPHHNFLFRLSPF